MNYDKIALSYDFLSRLVFGNSQVKAQVEFLNLIQANSKLLIVGGGTGWILDELDKMKILNLQVCYVEASLQMMLKAKSRATKHLNVEFHNIHIQDFISNQSFDFVLTPFLFDNLTESEINKAFNVINLSLLKGGKWVNVDFELSAKSPLWQKMMLKLMYKFFHFLKIIEAKELFNMEVLFLKQNYSKKIERLYYKGFIKSIVYKKN